MRIYEARDYDREDDGLGEDDPYKNMALLFSSKASPHRSLDSENNPSQG